MPKKHVVEMECDRCGRTWYPEVVKGEPEPSAPSAAAIFKDAAGKELVKVDYGVLCESCGKTVKNYLSNIGKDLKGRSPQRKAKEKGSGEAEASPSGPVTPPQHRAPHR